MQIDTTKEALKARVVKVRTEWQKGEKVDQFKLAVFGFIADSLGVTDQAVRLAGWKQFVTTTGSFGTNLSGFEQVMKLRTNGAKTLEEWTGKV